MKATPLYIKRIVDGKEEYFPSAADRICVGTYTYEGKRMGGAPTISAEIEYHRPLDNDWTHEEFVEFEGEKYYVTSIPSSSKDNSSRMYKHEITFYSRRELLDNTLFFDVVSASSADTSGGDKYRSNQTKFTFGGDIYEFVSRINDTMIYCGLYDTATKEGYSVVIDDGYGTSEVKELSFEDQYLTEVLQLINTEYELDYYWVGKTCHVGKVQNDLTDTTVEYGRDCELTSFSKENSNYKIVDMITGYGSSDNLQWYYPNEDQFGSAVFSVKNYNKDNVSVDLNKLHANFSDPYNKEFYLSRLAKSTYSNDYTIERTVSAAGQAWVDDTQGDRGSDGTLRVSAKFYCMPNCRIKLSNVKINDWNDGDDGIGCVFSARKFYIVKNGISETKNSLDDNYICSEEGVYEFIVEEEYQFYCGQSLPEGRDHVDGIAYLQLGGYITLGFTSDGGYFITNSDNDKQVKLDDSGIDIEGNIESVCATSTYESYQSQEEGIDGGYKLTGVTGKDKALTITVSGRSWILPSSTLMPSIYRKSGGAERFYYALDNTHLLPDGSGDYYSFKNQYVKGNPHQGSVSYDDIKPTINGITNASGQLIGEIADVAFDSANSDATDTDNNYIHPYFYIKLHKFDGDYGFDLFKHALATESATIEMIDCQGCPACSFTIQCVWSADNATCYNPVSVDASGNLLSVATEKNDYILSNAKAYEATLNQDSSKEELWIAVLKDTSTLGVVMPNAAGGFKPQKGDKFVITGISLPTAYIEAAEKRLDEALVKYMSENNEEQFNYSIKFSRVYLEEHPEFAAKLNENARLAIRYNGDTHEVFVSNYTVKVEDDILAEVEVELVNALETSQSEIKQMIDSVKGETISALKNLANNSGNSGSSKVDIAQLQQLFLSKTSDDTAQGLITFLKGIAFGSDGNCNISSEGVARLWSVLSPDFTSGLYGTGYKIDKDGDMEASSLTLREELSVPRIIYNEVTATPAEQWNTNGYGEIASVDTDKSIIYLKLEEDEYPKVMVGDICRAIFTDLGDAKGTSATEEGSLDDCGFVQHKGFFTTYFYVKRIIKSVKGECSFEYGLRSTSTPQPCAKMNFVQYGNFTNTDRQSSMYFCSRGRSYIEVLEGVNNWVIQSANRVCRYGSLDNLALKKKDGTYFYPEGNGLWVQDNVYFGGATIELANIADLDSLTEMAAAYDVTLSQYQSVITVDDEGNVIDGLYTEDSEKNTKQYRISTAVFVRKGDDILLEEEDESKTLESGQFRIHAVSEDCEVEVKNGTVFVTGITNIKDGVSGTDDDTDFDYDAMRQMSQAMVTIIVDLEGQTSKLVQMPIRIQHDSLPFMVCSLSNESAGVTWNERNGAYTGFPVESTVSLMYKNEAYAIKSISVGAVDGITASVSDNGKSKVVSLSVSGSGDCLAEVTKVPVTIVGTYAGANYEYTKEITISKVADGKSAPKAIVSDDLITIPTDSDGVSLGAFTESLTFVLNVGNEACTISSVTIDSKSLTGVSCSMSGSKAVVSCSEGASLGTASGRITFKVSGSLDNASYTDYVNVKVIPNVTGSDGDGYEYVYYLSSSSSAPSKPSRSGGSLSSGWTDDPQTVSASNPYQYVSYKTGKIGADATTSEWSTPKLWNKYASNGIGQVCAYQGASSQPSNKPTVTSYDSFESTTDLGNGWSKEATAGGVSVNNNCSGGTWIAVTDAGYTWWKSPSVSASSIATMRIYFTTTEANQSVTFYLKAYSETSYDFILISSLDSSSLSRDANYTNRTSGNGVQVSQTFTVASAGRHFVTVGYGKDGSNDSNGDYGLVRTEIGSTVLYRCDGEVGPLGYITWGNIYQASGKDGENGQDGAAGRGIESTTEYYKLTSSFSAPSTSEFSSTSPLEVTSSYPYLWKLTRYNYSNGDQEHTIELIAMRGSDGKDGEGKKGDTGDVGPIVRTHNGAESGTYQYYSKDAGQGYVDFVYEESAQCFYQCIKSTTSFSTSDTNCWKQISTYKAIATELLLAKSATINMAASQQVNILDDSSKIVGSFRKPSGTTGDESKWGLWLGGSNDGSSAPFRVNVDGTMYATNATLSGSVTATSGKIGGLKISGNALTNEGLNNDAYIILRDDSAGTFAGIGENVLPAETGASAVARFGNTKSNTYGTNYAMYVYAQNAATNIAIDVAHGNLFMNEGVISGFRLDVQNPTSGSTLTATGSGQHTAAFLASSGTVYLPTSAPLGQTFFIMSKNGGTVYIKTNGNYIQQASGTTNSLTLNDGSLAIAIKKDATYWSVWYMDKI